MHVNIFDLIDSRRTGATVQRFPNQAALKKYTRETQKIFPKQAAKADGFLKELLRKIFWLGTTGGTSPFNLMLGILLRGCKLGENYVERILECPMIHMIY